MAHIRKQFRDRLKTRLTGSPQAGARVFNRRSLPLGKDMLPTLVFAIQNERSSDVSMDGQQERVPTVRITAAVKGDDDVAEDLLDDMAVFVEGAIDADPTFGGLIETTEYQSTEFSFVDGGERTFCTAAFTFAITYFAMRGNPETSL